MRVDYSELVTAATALRAAGPALQPKAAPMVARTGYRTVAEAQALAPVDTGTLKSSISVDIDADGLGFVAGPTVNYGHFVEDGTSGPYEIPGAFGRDGSVMHPGIAPQPFMGPAFDGQLDGLEDAIADAAEDTLS